MLASFRVNFSLTLFRGFLLIENVEIIKSFSVLGVSAFSPACFETTVCARGLRCAVTAVTRHEIQILHIHLLIRSLRDPSSAVTIV